MNRVGQQLFQIAIPAAIGYALGRCHANSGAKHNEGLQGINDGKFSTPAPKERVQVTGQNSLRNGISTSSRTVETDYPSKDFLPFLVPHVDYTKVFNRLCGEPQDESQ